MTARGVGALVVIALAAGLALRLARLDARPMHHDEANQAVKFGALLERGEYRYDAHDHHGPTLYYLTLPAAWLRGQATLAALDERTLRGVTVAFGLLSILLLPLLSAPLGRTAVGMAALAMAVSPAMVFYSRMFIQESLFACFTLAFVIAFGRAVAGGRLGWSLLAGATAGLLVATKETSAIVLPATVAAAALAWWSLGPHRGSVVPRHDWRVGVGGAIGVAAVVSALFFSSFLAYPEDVLAPFRAAGTYLDRGLAPASHGQPWHYYLGLLAYSASGGVRWSEGVVLLLAAAGVLAARERVDATNPASAFWRRYVALVVFLTAGVFSGLRYKTPWNLLPFYVTTLVLAGIGASWVLHEARRRALRGLLVILFAAALLHLGWQAWRASVTYASDPRNPYVYAQTIPDAVRMAGRIRALAALRPDGERMQVSVIASPYEQWPLPWYLRSMPNVGYWEQPGDPLAVAAPVIVSSVEHTPALDEALGERYVSEFYGLRPEVPLALYIERGLWERFLATVDTSACRLPPAAYRYTIQTALESQAALRAPESGWRDDERSRTRSSACRLPPAAYRYTIQTALESPAGLPAPESRVQASAGERSGTRGRTPNAERQTDND